MKLRSQSSPFRDFEHAGWQGIPSLYHDAFGHLTTQAIEPLLDAVGAKAGVNLLDIATGPGYVAARAAMRGATVLGIDFSAAMVVEAQRLHPEVEFREADAEALPLGKGLFQAAVMNFGILHLDRPEQALAEARRILRTGGKFAFTVWAKPQETVGFDIVLGAIGAHGDLNVTLPPGPPFFRFSDAEECERCLKAAGFESPKVVKVPQMWRMPADDTLFNWMKDSTVRTAGLLRRQKPQALEKIRNRIREALEPYIKGTMVELPMPAMLASANKT